MEEDGVIEPLSETASEIAETTSDYEPSISESMFRSLTSSIQEHVYEYGRRYHTYQQGRYPLPNDEVENDREALKHVTIKELIGGRLHVAPIGENPQKIVDLGTGFGDWAIEVAEHYPSAQVIGVDLSPIQPAWVPPNLRFVVDDIEDEASWIHGDDVDFMHLRFILNFLTDVPKLVDNIYRHLRPGGFIELQDLCYKICSDDNTIPPNYPLVRLIDMVKRIFIEKYGFDLTHVENFTELLTSKGFVNVQRKLFKLPIGEWPKNPSLNAIGRYWRPVLIDFFSAMASKPFTEAEIDRHEVEDLIHQCHVAMANRRIHAYMVFHFVWAQKPE
ncbi:S-adenosyl-L-methionine-dependent methyltransferase [Thozetella sp. PMI_491]|nr:S-adenosyl-L-methionine-dependent methyltransferase [Thozetella sp. PMI_491]